MAILLIINHLLMTQIGQNEFVKTRGDDLQKSADLFPNGNFHLHYQAIALYNQYLWPSRVAEAPLPQPALPWTADYYTLYIIYR